MPSHDLAITLTDKTPDPISKYLRSKLVDLGLHVVYSSNGKVLILHMPTMLLERQATLLELEKPLNEDETLKWSEQSWPHRAFHIASRDRFSNAPFTPAERAFMAHEFLETSLLSDDPAWPAALVASGHSDAAVKWAHGPVDDGWVDQPLLSVLHRHGWLGEVSPLRGPEHHKSVGLPLDASQWGGWIQRAIKGDIVSIEGIRTYWGEAVAYYFAWQTFYIKMLSLPALVGLSVWAFRPPSITVDHDPNASLYSLLAVVWGILFVTRWRSREAELAFSWGTSSAHRRERLRPDFVGERIVDPITGKPRLHDPYSLRRYAASVGLTCLSLLVPVGAMIASLNLQGYIVAETGAWMGCRVYFPSLAQFAEPGALFDPNQDNPLLPLVPVVLHAVTIQVLNALFKSIAHALTEMENHRTQRTFESSMLFKRFAFEASDCYLALFYIAFELKDVPKLRAELVALFTADTVRRVLLETVVPICLNWRAVRKSSTTSRRWSAWSAPSEDTVHAEMELDQYEDFDDYLEMVIQLGYVVLFASAFPLAPAVCVVCNAIELIADSTKLAFLHRRPRPVRAASIGGWGTCCYVLVIASIYTNIYIMGVASDQMAAVFPSMFHGPDLASAPTRGGGGGPLGGLLRAIGIGRKAAMPISAGEMKEGMGRYVVLLMAAIEHSLLLLLLAAELVMSRPPAWVRLVMARRDYEERSLTSRASVAAGALVGTH